MNGVREISCYVCGDKASGKHYGVPSCDGCRGFFKRSIRRNLEYSCKDGGNCVVDVTRRNQCQACRFAKCLRVNMKRDAVQHERAPRSYIMPLEEFSHQNLSMSYCTMQSSYSNLNTNYPHHVFHPQSTFGCSVNLGINKFQFDTNPYGNENDATSLEEIKNPCGENRDRKSILNARFSATTNIYESACKVLFLAIRWTRSIPSFLQLNNCDQISLITECWNELFMVNSVQWSFSFPLYYDGLPGTEKDTKIVRIIEFQNKLREITARFNYLQVDYTEYACLKALILFKPESKNLQDKFHVELLQDQTQLMMHDYCIMKQSTRFGKLLLLLSSICSFLKSDLEEMFFNEVRGNLTIQSFILQMLH